MPMPHFIARIVTIGGILAVIAGLVLVSCTAARARDLDGRTARPPGLAGAIVWIWPGTENSASPIVTCFLPGAGI